MNAIETIGQIADLKNMDYKNTLAISTLIELLIDKGLFTRQEFAAKAGRLDREALIEPALLHPVASIHNMGTLKPRRNR